MVCAVCFSVFCDSGSSFVQVLSNSLRPSDAYMHQ